MNKSKFLFSGGGLNTQLGEVSEAGELLGVAEELPS